MERFAYKDLKGWYIKSKNGKRLRGPYAERLAAFERSGVEPCDYALVRSSLEKEEKAQADLGVAIHEAGRLAAELSAYRDLGSLDHLKELVQAESDGLLVVRPGVTEPTRAKIELPFHRGDRIYIVDNRVRGSIRVTRLESYLVYAENPVRVLVKCTANSSWHELKNVYATRKKAEAALAEKGAENA